MSWQWLEWKHSPWGKATASQWRFALRNSFAMCLALLIAYELNLDEPYWAMTSAGVVSFPTVGGVVSKSLGRCFGSLLGATAALLFAGNTLNDPWLFSLAMACWLGFCTFASNHFQNNSAYAFQLAGYTAALIAFPMVNSSDPTQLWDLAQARVCEVIIGILSSGFMMLAMPGNSDALALLNALKNMHSKLLEHANLLWRPDASDAIRTAHQNIISQILTMNLLRIQAFWTHYRFRQHNQLLNYLLHQQLRLISSISGIRRLLVSWPAAPKKLQEHLDVLLKELGQENTSKYTVARHLMQMMPLQTNDYQYMAFWRRLHSFCWQYINSSRWIRHLENATPVTSIIPPKAPPLAWYADNAEALVNGIRTFFIIIILCAFSIYTQWTASGGALTLAAICCVLYSAMPAPHNSLKMLLKSLALLSVLGFVVKFGLMVQINQVWQFLVIFLLPFIITLQLMRVQQVALAGLWRQVLMFMGSFLAVNNLPVYDFADYLNEDISKVIGVSLAWVAFSVLRPSSDVRRGQRHIRALRRGFMDQLSQHPVLSEHQFESLAYYHINQLNNSKEEQIRRWLLRWGVVLLNCSHVVWQLREWQRRSDPLSQVRDVCLTLLRDVMSTHGVQQKPLAAALEQLQHICTVLAKHPGLAAQELASIIWRLFCALSQLEQAPVIDQQQNKIDN